MATISRLYDFTPATLIQSGQVDGEFNQLVSLLNGTNTTYEVLISLPSSTLAPLTVNQTNTGPIAILQTSGSNLAAFQNAGSLALKNTASIGWTTGDPASASLGASLSFTSSNQINLNGTVSAVATARTTGAPSFYARIVTPADTGLTASTESVGFQAGGNTSAATVTRQWATGALTTQRENLFVNPTYAFVGSSTLTNAATVAIAGAPVAGTNATITNAYALWVQAGASLFAGQVQTTASATLAPLRVGSLAGDPSSLSNGDIWYNSTSNKWRIRENGASVDMIGSTGTVNTGAQYKIAYYPSAGTTVDDLSNLTSDASGVLSHATTARSGAGPSYYNRIITPADTTLFSGTECVGVQIGGDTSAASVTRQWTAGALGQQREYLFVRPTYAFSGGSTLTTAATVAITGAPAAGTNATITNPLALWVQAGNCAFVGKIGVGSTNATYPLDLRSADTGAAMIRMQHTDSGGFNAFDFINSAGTSVMGIGYGNSGTPSPFTNTAYISAVNGTNFCIFTAPTSTNVARWAFQNGGNLCGNSAVQLGWTSSSTDPTGSIDTGFLRVSAGLVRVVGASSAIGTLVRALRISANTGSTSPGTTDSDSVYTNEGATARQDNTLPSAAAGYSYTFYCQDADGIRITAATGDTIRIAASVSATAGRIDSTSVGASVTLTAINATEWVATSFTGTWTVT